MICIRTIMLSKPLVAPAVLAWLLLTASGWAADTPASRWEAEIRELERQDQETPPPSGEVLFIGSSSIRLWNLAESFPGRKYLNRGFGGSQIADSTYFADRILFPYQPRTVVLYAGDNDIAAGKTPQAVAADFQAFVETVHARLPETRIVFIAIKPSLARWTLVDKMRQANARIKQYSETDGRLVFVDIDTPMLGAEGKPRPELLAEDGLHLSPAGYALWTSLLAPHIKPPASGASR